MITLHATKKLSSKLPIDEYGRLPVPKRGQRLFEVIADNPLNNWHGNLLTIQRRNCLLFVHDQTRFAVFMPCLTKPDLANLDYEFDHCFMNTLLKCGATDQQMDRASTLLAPLVIDNNCNRSVQGTLNQAKFETEHYIAHNGVDITEITGYRLGAWLNEFPRNAKGQKDYIFPTQAMLALLED